MRKLTYVGTNASNETVETSSFGKMTELKKQGFVFREEMRDVKEERDNKRAKKLEEIAKAKKNAEALV